MVDTSNKELLLDNPLASEEVLEFILPASYDYFDSFNEVTGEVIPDNCEVDDKSVVTVDASPSNLSTNFTEMMSDFADLISLDKVLALHHDWTTESPLIDLTSQNNCAADNNKKRSHDNDTMIIDNVRSFSPIPDHNYSVINQKRSKFDESATSESCSGTETEVPIPRRTTKYLERRKKNNIASKRSRETRKNRFLEMEVQANELEGENDKLRDRITQLEKLTQQMKEVLVKRLTK
jgi:hypothetical protein